MKLAEGLIERADMQTAITQIKGRIKQNIRVQDGDEPIEDASELLKQYDIVMEKLEKLVVRINRTNAAAGFEEGVLADAIAKRDSIKTKIAAYRELCDEASVRRTHSYDRTSIKYEPCVDVSEMRKKIDLLSKQHRELDCKIQCANWHIELL